MQEAIYSLAKWSHTLGLHISPGKTVGMLFNRIRKSPCPTLLLGGTQLEYVGSHKFRGMTLDRKLSWSTHILSLRDRCRKDLRIRSIISARNGGAVRADTISISRIYRSLILPKLDYRSFLYSTAAPSYLRMWTGSNMCYSNNLGCSQVCHGGLLGGRGKHHAISLQKERASHQIHHSYFEHFTSPFF